MFLAVLCLLISLGASVIGSICGVGGGVLMKPLLDLTGVFTVPVASFLSSVTVLSMTGYNTARNLCGKKSAVDVPTLLPLAIGAAAGGVAGQRVFALIKAAGGNTVGIIQSIALLLLVSATLVYTLNKHRITPHQLTSSLPRLAVGCALGIVSSFLGIGGGPFNLSVLHFFFGQDTKQAAQSSLFVILFSQLFSLITTLISGTVPAFEPLILIIMICGGVGGGIIGKKAGTKLSGKQTDKLFIALIAVIILICVYNTVKFIA